MLSKVQPLSLSHTIHERALKATMLSHFHCATARAFDKKSLAGDSEEADPMDRDRHGLLELPVD